MVVGEIGHLGQLVEAIVEDQDQENAISQSQLMEGMIVLVMVKILTNVVQTQ